MRSQNGLAEAPRAFIREEDGPTAVEYAVMLGLVMAVVMVAVTTLGQQVNGLFASVAAVFP